MTLLAIHQTTYQQLPNNIRTSSKEPLLMPIIELYDTVVLKADRKLYGTVERIHYDSGEPLNDCLIIAHVPVEPEALAEFVDTGIPPRGYIFILLADVTLGHVLVRQDEVELINRAFDCGDYVKRGNNPMLGSIIDFTETFVLQPVWKTRPKTITDEEWPVLASNDPLRMPIHTCGDACPIPNLKTSPNALASDLIFDVTGQELRKACDTNGGNLLIKDDFLGLVDELVQKVTLMMEDGSIVVVAEAAELYVPLPDFGEKPFVSLPEFDPAIPKPDIVVAQNGWSATIPLPHDECYTGQLVVTNGRNLRAGRWLRGKYNSEIPHQGRIIDVRSADLQARWLVSSPFPRAKNHRREVPSTEIELYDNVRTFPKPSELRRDKSIMLLDQSRPVLELDDRRRTRTEPKYKKYSSYPTTPTDLQVGDQVKFRDQAGAAVKYQGVATADGVVHGAFERISPASALGFDLNNLKVVSSKQKVAVRWQDGTVSEHESISLRKYDLFEFDFMPSDMVVAREGMKQIAAGCYLNARESEWSPYNEMTVFEKPHDIRPQKVGLIQTVNPLERVAQIKWYLNPSVYLHGSDHSVLSRFARLGQLSDEIEEVSLYEIMTFPALSRHLSDLVIIPPSQLSTPAITNLARALVKSGNAGMSTASNIHAPLRSKCALLTAVGVIDHGKFESAVGPQPLDWCGEIVSLDVDGSVKVRVNVGEWSKDVLVERDQLIMHIDETLLAWGGDAYVEDTAKFAHDDFLTRYESEIEKSDGASAIAESIEYEGGLRLDDDSDDGDWEDDEEEEEMDNDNGNYNEREQDDDDDLEMMDDASLREDIDKQGNSQQQSVNEVLPTVEASKNENLTSADLQSNKGKDDAISRLCNITNSESPLPFAILDTPPPSDQFQWASGSSNTSAASLKRILREHQILSTSLPNGEIYVRTYETRLDLMRCLIIGPPDSPFEYAPFVFDLQIPSKFPAEPPVAHFHSWTHGLGRINPNLYEEGKICLSLLGTWQGKGENESWTENSTILQILVSIQGLVFVPRPFYNEAGYEEAAEVDGYPIESLRYNEKIFVMARAFVKHALRNVIEGLEDILAWMYLPRGDELGLLGTVITRARRLIQESQDQSGSHGTSDDSKPQHKTQEKLVDGQGGSRGDKTKTFLNPLSRGAIVMLSKTLLDLEDLADTIKKFQNQPRAQDTPMTDVQV